MTVSLPSNRIVIIINVCISSSGAGSRGGVDASDLHIVTVVARATQIQVT